MRQVRTKFRPDFDRDATLRPPSSDDTGREAVMLSIKRALVTARLTLTDSDAGADPYNSHEGKSRDFEPGRPNRF